MKVVHDRHRQAIRFFLLATVYALLATGCADNAKEPPKPSTQEQPLEAIVSVTLPSRGPAGATRFKQFGPDASGVHFVNPLDTDHPMKRLYASAYACGGAAIGDVDGNGLPDLFLTGGPRSNKLYCQVGALRFEDATKRARLDTAGIWSAGAAMADVDNDGDLDIYVANYDAPNSLYINQGQGRFAEQAKAQGVDIVDASLLPTFCDYDGDGDLDMYLLTYRYYRAGGRPAAPPVGFRAGQPHILPEFEKYYALVRTGPKDFSIEDAGRPDYLMRNNGDGTFTDVTKAAGLAGNDPGLSATWWDYDEDGHLDLYVGNDFNMPDRFYRNNGDGTFTDVLAEAVPHTSWFSMGADFADLNDDGRLDLLVADMSSTTHFAQKTTMGAMNAREITKVAGPPPQIMRNALYLNTSTGRFMEGAYLAGLADSDWTWAVKLADLDGDGRTDVFVTNGIARNVTHSDRPIMGTNNIGKTEWDHHENTPPRREQNFAFRNRGGLEFEDATKKWGLDHVGMSYAAAYSDLDRDGDLDLVVVNLDEPVSIYRNQSAEHHRVLIRLRGTRSNSFGIGAVVRVESESRRQIRQLSPMTGFLSSNEPLVHFGLGKDERISQLSVTWPSGHVQHFENLSANRFYTITEPQQMPPTRQRPEAEPMMFVRSRALSQAKHQESEYDDFKRQPLLPNKLSQLGPGMAWGDVDGDGDNDCFLGQSAGMPSVLLLDLGNGDFGADTAAFADDRACEDMAPLFFDSDGDGDLDLYVVSGSVEAEPNDPVYRDRLYLNNGKGDFIKAADGTLPDVRDSGSVVTAADFDRDGDLDLFVGGRVIPGKYPLTPHSRLLRNTGGKLDDVTDQLAPGLKSTGLVTGALWSDADGDGWLDLFVTHEWGPVKLWRNNGGKLSDATKAAGLAERFGWFNGIDGRDIDNDGDIDYVVTNFGLNTKYHASPEKPALLYYGDFERQGKYKLVEAEYEAKSLFPIRGKSCLTSAMPFLGDKFKTYHEFALASLSDIYSPKCLAEAHRFAATDLQSGVLLNDGAARFQFRPLPRLAQVSPGFGVVFTDVNGDGHADLYLVQNFFTPQLETGRMDGGLSLLLTGNGDGTFTPVWPNESGLVVPGDAKSLVAADLNKDGWPDFVVGVNNDEVLTFINRHPTDNHVFNVRLKGKPGNPTGVGASVTLTTDDGSTQTAEVRAGSGYLSQSPAMLTFGLGKALQAAALHVRWPNGEVTNHKIADSSGRVVVEQP